MKNCKVYDKDSFAFYKAICNKKRNNALKIRLEALDPEMESLYEDYDEKFNLNTLEALNARGYIDPEKIDLDQLYNYNSELMVKLRHYLTTTDTGRVVKCQQCTINDVNTFDHLVPRGDFTEFSIHPKNLICCCGDCNSRKNNLWRNAAGRTTLNLYLDMLPDVQYLFAEVSVGNKAIEVSFNLSNNNGVDPILFNLLNQHYTRLNLFERFTEASDTVITSLRAILEQLKILNDDAQKKAIILGSIVSEQEAFGRNYWQAVLKLSLVNDDDFMAEYLQQA